jgi:hypothetical protein
VYQNLIVHGYQNLMVHGYQKNILSTSQKKEDIKKDEQIKIKILKSFDDGLQYKNKKVWDYKGTTSSLT